MAKAPPKEPEGKICIAQFGAPHGVRGEIRLKLFSDDPEALVRYGALQTADNTRSFTIKSARPAKSVFVCQVKEIKDRNDAETLNGIKLYIDRDLLPEVEADEFYYSDLIGLAALSKDGEELGIVLGVHDFGAGELLDIAPKHGKSFLLPFTKEAVPSIDIAEGYVTIDPPEGLMNEPEAEERQKEGKGADFSQNPELLEGLKKS